MVSKTKRKKWLTKGTNEKIKRKEKRNDNLLEAR